MAGRALVLVLIVCLAPGCSVRFAYEHADRLLVWQAGEYVDLDRAQRAWLRARMRLFLHWHRTNQLPAWAAALRTFDLAVRDGVRGEDLDALVADGERYDDEIVMEILPTLTELLAALSDEQIAGLPAAFAERNAELNEDYEGLAPAAQREIWKEEMRDAVEDWIGRLDARQELLLDAASTEVVPDNAHWIGYRERWQARLMAALRRREERDRLAETLRALMTERERFYTEQYAATRTRNDAVYRRFTIDLLASLDEGQRTRLSRRLTDLAEDFEVLARRADAEPPADPGPAPAGR